jgi:DNA polymerase-1
MNQYVIVDLETTGLNPLTDSIHGVGVQWPDGRLEYHKGGPSSELQLWLKNPAAHVVGHNLRFDIKFLRAAGFQVNAQTWDTKLLAQLINENQQLGLKPLSEKYFGASSLEGKRELDRAVGSINGKSVADLCKADIESGFTRFYGIISEYCLEDCVNTKNLWEKLIADVKIVDQKAKAFGLKKSPLDYYMEETMPLEKVLTDMELMGIRIDLNKLKSFRNQLLAETNVLLQQMFEIAKEHINGIEEDLYQEVIATKKSDKGKANVLRSSPKYGTVFNWQSADHIRALIFDKFKAPTVGVDKTDSGKISTSEASLESLAKNIKGSTPLAEFLRNYSVWKKNLKILTTYTGEDKGLASHVIRDRIHADYLQAGHGKESSQGGTVTGRLSSRNPNMQNLPRGSEIKRFFVPDAGQAFIYFDYSQLELRLAAHLSQDPLLIKAYREGLDLHQLTADAIGEDRQMGKTINFAMIYDASPWRLAEILGKVPDECYEIIDNFYGLYSGYKKYLEDQAHHMKVHAWVASECGRVRRLPELKLHQFGTKEFKHAIKQGYNFPIQSLGASITKRAMIELHRRGYKIVSQVHDSVVCQVPLEDCNRALTEIVTVAENIYSTSVPLKVDAKILTSLHESDKLGVTNEQQRSIDRKDSSGYQSIA